MRFDDIEVGHIYRNNINYDKENNTFGGHTYPQ